jgi:hypothetical protein
MPPTARCQRPRLSSAAPAYPHLQISLELARVPHTLACLAQQTDALPGRVFFTLLCVHTLRLMTASPRPPSGSSGKAKADEKNFRARRLSVSDIDTSEFDKAKTNVASPAAPGQRARRMSMRCARTSHGP